MGNSSSHAEPGLLFPAGGGKTPPELANRFIAACGGPEAKIIVLPQTSSNPENSNGSKEFLEEHGAKHVVIFKKRSLTDEDRKQFVELCKDTKGFWIPGGVQGRLVRTFGVDWARSFFQEKLAQGVHFYGTSAGAMVMSDPMIYGPGKTEGTSEIGPGLGLTKWIIDTHYRERKREPRLQFALKEAKREFGLGISERSWAVIQGDKILEKHGAVDEVILKPQKN